MVSNKIRLNGKFEYLDQRPCVLIVPVLTLQEALEWKGEGYSAIVMPGDINSDIVENTENQSVSLEPMELLPVCEGIGMYEEEEDGVPHPDKIAKEDQVNMALALLRDVV